MRYYLNHKRIAVTAFLEFLNKLSMKETLIHKEKQEQYYTQIAVTVFPSSDSKEKLKTRQTIAVTVFSGISE